ncbi:zinc finger protein 271 isoform X2 [Micropterus dolomieu]|uniref:zinc finger protein 271 isoform X2 n=1 Tax=Micropterus dolomieu TaxID=147949 RepID=UPI001E8E27B9|nr:zinc finger protein 271 isoform X2 [Micropterus dolomieu]
MDEAAAAAIKEDGAEKNPHNGDGASENDVGPSAEDTAHSNIEQCSFACEDCGLKFTCQDLFKTHLHQHALEEEDEQEEAQMRDYRNPSVELNSGRVDNGEHRAEDVGGDADGCGVYSSSQSNLSDLIQGVGVSTASVNNKNQKVHACLVCGKAYTYLVSFRKHQRLHENQSPPVKSETVQNLHKYECSECGMSFIRRARLRGHLRVHMSRRSIKSKPPRCDQCNRGFSSLKSWMVHIDLHKQKPFWCLSCAKGFKEEESLDKHLQNHNLRQHTCDVCHKSFRMSIQLVNHYKTHNGAKPHQCTYCGRNFTHHGNLILHRKKHLGVYVGFSGKSLGMKTSAITLKKHRIKEKSLILTSVKEESDVDINIEGLPGKEECVETSETEKPADCGRLGDHSNSDESDCGEPVHVFKPSKPHSSPGCDVHDESKSETVLPQAGQELDKSESQETKIHREHKYWEWECCECDMGFDEVANLHWHYLKHATGELPIPQDDIEG